MRGWIILIWNIKSYLVRYNIDFYQINHEYENIFYFIIFYLFFNILNKLNNF